jgi:subtilase family serine protease
VERLSTVQARSLQDRLLAGRAGAEGGYPICRAHRLTCDADILTRDGSTAPLTAFTPFGLGPRNLEAAYRVRRQPGGGGTIAVIDAGAYPIIESDLNAYRTQFGIPKCRRSTGCLRVLNFDGGPQRAPARTSLGKANEEMLGLETALDVDAASAACPRCRLIVLQVPLRDALLSTTADTHRAERHFATGVRTARRLGADAVNISFGLPSDLYATSGAPARMMRLAGIAVTSSTGDFGYNGLAPPWPQVLPTVIAVGGTALTQASNGTWHESAWSGAGSGCAPGVRPANGQPVWVSNTCNGARASADISAVADPVTGVSVFDTYAPASDLPFKWVVMGGTSASSPLVAGLYARAGVPAGVDGPNQLYRQPAADFYDVLAGANAARGICSADGVSERVCTADVGWDGPTGRGTPRGFATFR